MVQIRMIAKEEADKFWKLRLEALQKNPEAFGSTYEESVNSTIESVRDRISTSDDNYILGAFSPLDELVGMVGFKRETATKLRHKGFIWGMYVTEAYRKQGTGRVLIQEVISRAQELDDLTQINLTVVSTNEGARKLYQSLGFAVYGMEKNALRQSGQLFDEELMSYSLK